MKWLFPSLRGLKMRFGQALLNANDKRQASIDLLLDEIATLSWTAAAADRP
jgi:hypothetical protein